MSNHRLLLATVAAVALLARVDTASALGTESYAASSAKCPKMAIAVIHLPVSFSAAQVSQASDPCHKRCSKDEAFIESEAFVQADPAFEAGARGCCASLPFECRFYARGEVAGRPYCIWIPTSPGQPNPC